jgi:hypothetical protein
MNHPVVEGKNKKGEKLNADLLQKKPYKKQNAIPFNNIFTIHAPSK